MLYTPAIAAVKFSVLLLYRRLFPGRTFQKTLWVLGGFIFCYTVTQELTVVLECIPVAGAWNPAIHAKAKCIRLNLEWVIMASLNVVTDVLTLFLPLPLLWRLQIDKERKYQLIGIFLLGGL